MNLFHWTHRIVAMCSLWSVVSLGSSYTMKDLELLFSQKSYREVIEHIADIPPTARNKAWINVLANSSIEQARLIKKTENCRSAFSFLIDLHTEHPILGDERSVVSETSEMGVCAIETGNIYNRDEVVDQIKKLDPSEETLYQLATRTYYDDGFLDLIARKKEKYKNDAKVHAYLFNRAIDQVDFKDPRGKKVKELVIYYGLLQKKEYIDLAREKIEKEFKYAVEHTSKLSLTKGDKNLLDLVVEYKLLPSEKLQQIQLLQDKGFWTMAVAYKKQFSSNEAVFDRIAYDWDRLDPKDEKREQFKTLILAYRLCDQEKYAERLTHQKRYRETIAESLQKSREVFAYHRGSESYDVADLRLAEACGAMKKSEIDEFYFLSYLYALPMGEYKKPNPIFFEAIKRFEKMAPAQKAKLAMLVAKHQLKGLFRGYHQLPKKDAVRFVAMFPELKKIADKDCPIVMKNDDYSKSKEMTVHAVDTCKKMYE